MIERQDAPWIIEGSMNSLLARCRRHAMPEVHRRIS
jgi:hypothetical protein